MNVDKTNLAIIKHLRNGRKSYKKIAQNLSLSEIRSERASKN